MIKIENMCLHQFTSNIDSPKLSNGTKLNAKTLHRNLIKATTPQTWCLHLHKIPSLSRQRVLSLPDLVGNACCVPKPLTFAMGINKALGQSLHVAGINMEQPCVAHGQLYMACSRAGLPKLYSSSYTMAQQKFNLTSCDLIELLKFLNRQKLVQAPT